MSGLESLDLDVGWKILSDPGQEVGEGGSKSNDKGSEQCSKDSLKDSGTSRISHCE
jgi:hypothetical protein